jgi:hypothetical protein
MRHSGIVLSSSEVKLCLLTSFPVLIISLIEWALTAEFNTTDKFLRRWADAQKLAYSKGAGWIVSSQLPDYWAEELRIETWCYFYSFGTSSSRNPS